MRVGLIALMLLLPAAGWAQRYPQAVAASSLVGRPVLQPVESKTLLGRVRQVIRLPDGSAGVVMERGGLFADLFWDVFGRQTVVVPVSALALVGDELSLVGLTPAQLRALPTGAGLSTPLAPDAVIRVGLARPSH